MTAPTAPGIATALMFGIAQIVEGEATCAFCDQEACFTTWNGADPGPEPACFEHGMSLIDTMRRLSVAIFGPKD